MPFFKKADRLRAMRIERMLLQYHEIPALEDIMQANVQALREARAKFRGDSFQDASKQIDHISRMEALHAQSEENFSNAHVRLTRLKSWE